MSLKDVYLGRSNSIEIVTEDKIDFEFDNRIYNYSFFLTFCIFNTLSGLIIVPHILNSKQSQTFLK